MNALQTYLKKTLEPHVTAQEWDHVLQLISEVAEESYYDGYDAARSELAEDYIRGYKDGKEATRNEIRSY